MTDPSPRKGAEDWWQAALIPIEPNQYKIYRGGTRRALGN